MGITHWDAHWDEVEGERLEEGHLAGTWYDLGEAAGTRDVGVTRIQIEAGRWSTPAHVELDEEEIFYVLGGSGLSWQDGKTYEVRAGDCIVHRVAHEVHTLYASDDGLDVLAFGERTNATATYLPRATVLRMGPTVDASEGPHPWAREAAAGAPELPEPSKRPPNIVNIDDAESHEWHERDGGGLVRSLAASAGSVRTGLNHETIPPGLLNTTPHCHSAEEEIFVILGGEGTLLLGDDEHPMRPGHVVARPPGTRVAHAFRAGEAGLTMLSYGTREPNDITYYPRSGVFALRGIGLIGKIEPVDPSEIY